MSYQLKTPFIKEVDYEVDLKERFYEKDDYAKVNLVIFANKTYLTNLLEDINEWERWDFFTDDISTKIESLMKYTDHKRKYLSKLLGFDKTSTSVDSSSSKLFINAAKAINIKKYTKKIRTCDAIEYNCHKTHANPQKDTKLNYVVLNLTYDKFIKFGGYEHIDKDLLKNILQYWLTNAGKYKPGEDFVAYLQVENDSYYCERCYIMTIGAKLRNGMMRPCTIFKNNYVFYMKHKNKLGETVRVYKYFRYKDDLTKYLNSTYHIHATGLDLIETIKGRFSEVVFNGKINDLRNNHGLKIISRSTFEPTYSRKPMLFIDHFELLEEE